MLQVRIDGPWEPVDFIQYLQCIESMYYKIPDYDSGRVFWWRYFLRELHIVEAEVERFSYPDILDAINRRISDQARFGAYPFRRLKVAKIEYASPGGIDLLGLGKASEEIHNTIKTLLDFLKERRVRRERDRQESIRTEREKVALEIDRESLTTIKIDNAERMFRLHRDYPEYREFMIPLFVRDQDALWKLISEGKITDARISGDD